VDEPPYLTLDEYTQNNGRQDLKMGNVPLVQQKEKGHGRRFNHKTNQP